MFAFITKAMAPIRATIEALLLRDKHKKSQLTLGHSTLYVLPSKLGMFFLVVAALNFILGANYQNNLIHISAYLMLVLVLMSLIQAYTNMKGLTIEYQDAPDVFANQPISLTLSIRNRQRSSHAVVFSWHGNEHLVDLISQDTLNINLVGRKLPRGKYPLFRLKISSAFPFSLAQVWSYLEPNRSLYVYPATLAHQHPLGDYPSDSDEVSVSTMSKSGNDEFDGLKEQKHQADYRRISWKHFAKREELLVKEFITDAQSAKVLDYEQLSGSLEQRLSMMAYTIEQAKQSGHLIAIKIPGMLPVTAQSKDEYQSLLRLLASFNLGKRQNG